MTRRHLAALLLAAGAGTARAQTMLEQEQRLIELHSLLAALPALAPPGAYAAGQASLGLELVTIPTIDGTTGGRVQITASDRTRVFPRLRAAYGLPMPGGFRAFGGLGYIPPVELNRVSSHLGALEAGVAWAPAELAVGLRGHALYARSQSPVTDLSTRDTLRSIEYGAEASVGYKVELGWASLTPYLGAGITHVDGRFTVTSDGSVLTSKTDDPGLSAGVRLLSTRRLEGVAELVAFPGRLVHTNFRIAWLPW